MLDIIYKQVQEKMDNEEGPQYLSKLLPLFEHLPQSSSPAGKEKDNYLFFLLLSVMRDLHRSVENRCFSAR